MMFQHHRFFLGLWGNRLALQITGVHMDYGDIPNKKRSKDPTIILQSEIASSLYTKEDSVQ